MDIEAMFLLQKIEDFIDKEKTSNEIVSWTLKDNAPDDLKKALANYKKKCEEKIEHDS